MLIKLMDNGRPFLEVGVFIESGQTVETPQDQFINNENESPVTVSYQIPKNVDEVNRFGSQNTSGLISIGPSYQVSIAPRVFQTVLSTMELGGASPRISKYIIIRLLAVIVEEEVRTNTHIS